MKFLKYINMHRVSAFKYETTQTHLYQPKSNLVENQVTTKEEIFCERTNLVL